MTMADTVAVMNAGVIEQMGAPRELYEHPRSTFVANFLGQSNLIQGTVTGRADDRTQVEVGGGRLIAPTPAEPLQGDVWMGIRPEKVFLAPGGSEDTDGETNALRGGRISDVSFIGVSTQYLVRMPWGQELMAFEQNTGARQDFSVGDTVDMHWQPGHTFLLDADQDADAGVHDGDES